MITELNLLKLHGKQYIPDITKAKVPEPYKGKPLINKEPADESFLQNICPTNAIQKNPFSIDLGKCTFCGACAFYAPQKIKFTNDHNMATNVRENLIITEGENNNILLNEELIRKEIRSLFGRSLKLRQVCAGGDNSTELELNATENVNFDMGRFGINFVASPRHADGIVISGPISENMAEATQICFDAVPHPKIIILAGTDAISGGIFEGSPALKREFLQKYSIDLYVPGNPPHPLTFINGILKLIRSKRAS